MANLIFLPIADNIESGSYLLYDCACGTGGMLTVAEETLKDLANQRNKQVVTHLYGQEINPETFAICEADMVFKGEDENADHIVGSCDPSRLALIKLGTNASELIHLTVELIMVHITESFQIFQAICSLVLVLDCDEAQGTYGGPPVRAWNGSSRTEHN